MMNEIKLMKEAFSFLIENGCAISVEKSNVEYCVTYFKSDKQIVLSYDLRQHRFDVGIRNVKGSSNYDATYLPLLETDVGDTIQKEQLIDALNVLYHQAETDWTISKKHFSEIVNAYAEFVKNNLSAILIYC
jgi:hypothetical protein